MPTLTHETINWIETILNQSIKRIVTIPHALTNQCYKIEAQSGAFYFFKLYNSNKVTLSERKTEQQVTDFLANHKLTLRPIAYHDKLGCELSNYIEAEPLSLSPEQQHTTITLLSDCLFYLHQFKQETQCLPLIQQRLVYDVQKLLNIRNQNTNCTEIDKGRVKRNDKTNEDTIRYILNLADKLDKAAAHDDALNCLCHGDLSIHNVLASTPPTIIDWEYARRAPPEYDLAACITINQLNKSQQALLIDQYLQKTALSTTEQDTFKLRTQDYISVFMTLNKLWFNLH
ncbi:phosphotransferase [Algibacillus agarilyticus]|uniref:phosphotransferase n=1 Tax=Algibacillus agarilyticus TaxID=2234133 RepID=UPI000DCFCCE9|nr:phosphotransferase [Algibacillus agarilyticus]